MTKQEISKINDIIAKGLGWKVRTVFGSGQLEYQRPGTDYWRYAKPTFFNWEGFGLMLEWMEAHEESTRRLDTTRFMTAKVKDWPKEVALALASHFTHSPVSLDEENANENR